MWPAKLFQKIRFNVGRLFFETPNVLKGAASARGFPIFNCRFYNDQPHPQGIVDKVA